MLVFVLAPFMLLKACQWSDAHPTDQVMIQELHANKASFETLVKMVSEERRVTRIADDFIWIDGIRSVSKEERPRFLPDARYARYRSLFRELKLESGVLRHQDGSIEFLRSSRGFVTSGSAKSFIWSRKPLAPALEPSDPRSLEDACIPKSGCFSRRRIAPTWYISFESD